MSFYRNNRSPVLGLFKRYPLFLRLFLVQVLLFLPLAAGLLLAGKLDWALLLSLAAAAGLLADGLMLLSMRLSASAGLGLGLLLRWVLLVAVLALAASRLPLWPDMLLFALCLAGLRPLASVLMGRDAGTSGTAPAKG